MSQVEDRHWWYRGMREITGALLGPPEGRLEILDAGCGTGGTTDWLRHYGRVTGFDHSSLALDRARDRLAAEYAPWLSQSSVASLPFADGAFDLATTFDVLYHRAVGDDVAALRELARVLRPHGRLLIRLPAFDWLRGAHDLAVHTERRYTAGSLRRKLSEAGFDVARLTYANTVLFPFAVAKRLAERDAPAGVSDLDVPPPPVNRVLLSILEVEAAWLRLGSLPFGLSVFAVAERVY